MNTRLETDSELLELVRAADPMLDPRVQADAGLDTESALRLLAPELDRPRVPRRARRRRVALRIAVLAGVVAALVFVVTNVASTGNGSGVSQAQAQTILRHIRDALRWPPRAIYEEVDKTTVTARDGATFTSEIHAWQSTSPPHDTRFVYIANGKVQWEQASVGGRLDIYAPTTNTVYLAPVAQNQVPNAPQWNSVLSWVQDLLQQAETKINPHAMLDGKQAIELTFDRGRFSYWIQPETYRPLQSVDRWDSLPNGQGGVGITRYPIARVLTGPAAPHSLLSLHAHHPSATVDHSSTDYAAILSRLANVGTGVL
jgi:hypothetical protein